MTYELKRCPFCGSTNVEVMEDFAEETLFLAVCCNNCDAAQISEMSRNTIETLVAQWNRRA